VNRSFNLTFRNVLVSPMEIIYMLSSKTLQSAIAGSITNGRGSSMAGSASIVVTIAEILLQCSELLEWRSQVPGIFHAKMQFDQIRRSPNMCPVRIHTRYLPHASTNLLSDFHSFLAISSLFYLLSCSIWTHPTAFVQQLESRVSITHTLLASWSRKAAVTSSPFPIFD